jgi:predicted nucleic acid-binding protein
MFKLVIDANIILSALIKDSITRKILIGSAVDFYAPNYLIEEVEKYMSLVSRKNSLSEQENKKILDILCNYITIVGIEFYEENINEALKIMADIDIKDTPYVALALSFDNDGIWSEDKGFFKQDKIKVWNTQEIIKSLR